MKTVHIAGVPEHFNFPWHLARQEGAFAARRIDLQWRDVPEGSGKMCELLQRGETDIAVILTEAVIRSICEGNRVRIVQEYVASPLLWGIHVDAHAPFRETEDLKGRKAAISRKGSGSHLMAYLHARDRAWETTTLPFEIVHTLEGAINALAEGAADYFLWEHFTTKPLVDSGTFRRLGDFPTPWPCFVIAVREAFLRENRSLVSNLLEVINMYTADIHTTPGIDRRLAATYSQQEADIRKWLSKTRWSQESISLQEVENVIDALFDLKLIEKKIPAIQFLDG